MLLGLRCGDADTNDVHSLSSCDHAGFVVFVLNLCKTAEASTPVPYARANLNTAALSVKTARYVQGLNKQRRTTELSDFAVETTFGKDGAKMV